MKTGWRTLRGMSEVQFGEVCLTEREVEVAKLVFGGMSCREAAERMVLSKRTIDSSLAQTYTKLGVSGRFDAFMRLKELGILS
jgi:ATP/maltotriose-dependent transcriptional regulator MalT